MPADAAGSTRGDESWANGRSLAGRESGSIQSERQSAGLSSEPFYFGSESESLFGCYHPPQGSAARDSGVVLCAPMAHELIRSHRAFRRLAMQLSMVGFPVLRFDYFGTGDSAGESDDARLDRWAADVAAASRELRRRAGVSRLSLVGLRLGAALALRAAMEDRSVQRLVLWQPAFDGKAMLAEFADHHAVHAEAMNRSSAVAAATQTQDVTDAMEVLGFTYSSAMQSDLEAFNVSEVDRAPARDVLIVDNGESGNEFASFADHLRSLGARVTVRHCPDHQIWLAEPYRLLLPHESTKAIREWSTSTCR